MFSLILINLLMVQNNFEKYSLFRVTKTVDAETDKDVFAYPTHIVHNSHFIFLIDGKSLKIWKYDYRNNIFSTFSGKGSAPGELQKEIIQLAFKDNQLIVHHTNGLRLEFFGTQGRLLNSERVSQQFSNYINRESCDVLRVGESVLLNNNMEEKKTWSFDKSIYGFRISAVAYQKYLFIATDETKNNTVSYVCIDLEQCEISDTNVFEKIQKTLPEDMPNLEEIGAPPGSFFERAYRPIVTHQDFGIIIKETSRTKFKDKSLGYYSTLHIYHPATKGYRLVRLYHNEFKDFAMLFPLTIDQWLAYDGYLGQFLHFEVKKIP